MMSVSLSAPVVQHRGTNGLSAKVPNGTKGKLLWAAKPPLAFSSANLLQASRGRMVSIVGETRKCIDTLQGRGKMGVRRVMARAESAPNAASTEEGGNQKRAKEAKEAGIDSKR